MLETKQYLLITNNDKVYFKYKDKFTVIFPNISYLEILQLVRDKVHSNYKILTHPMAGSLKPNQTPYKSVLLMPSDTIDYNSITLIENAIESANKFLKFKSLPKWSNSILNDFKTLDLSFMDGATLNKSTYINSL